MSENSEKHADQYVYFYVDDFLRHYENYPCLWDKKHRHFRNRMKRAKCESELCKALGINDIITLRKKIRSIRGMYNTEIRKVKYCMDRGIGPYIPKLAWFSRADKFLRITTDLPYDVFPLMDDSDSSMRVNIVYTAEKRRNESCVLEEDEKKQKMNEENEVLYRLENLKGKEVLEDEGSIEYLDDYDCTQESIEDIVTKEEEIEVTEYDEMENLVETGSSVPEQVIEESSSMYKLEGQESFNEPKHTVGSQYCSKNNDLSVIVKYLETLAKSSENEFTAFGRSVAIQLQNMPLELALQLQTDIQAHITKCRIDCLSNKNRNSKS